MWSESQIRRAAEIWRSASNALETLSDSSEVSDWRRGLAEGYAAALEMVLGEEK